MASVKGHPHKIWTSSSQTTLMRVIAALIFVQDPRLPNLKGAAKEAFMVKRFYQICPWAQEYFEVKLTSKSVYGRAFTPWAKSKPTENPYTNQYSKPYIVAADQILGLYYDSGVVLDKHQFDLTAKMKRVPDDLLGPPAPPVPPDDWLARFRRAFPYSRLYSMEKRYYPNRLYADDRDAPRALWLEVFQKERDYSLNLAALKALGHALNREKVDAAWVVFSSERTPVACVSVQEMLAYVELLEPSEGKHGLYYWVEIPGNNPRDVL